MSEYAVYGKNEYRETVQIQRILKEERVEKTQVVEIDASNASQFRMEDALTQCNMMTLFSDQGRRAVILKNPYFLKSSDKAKADGKTKDTKRERMISLLAEYLAHPNPDTALIFDLQGNDIDTRRKETKLLEKYHVKMIACNLIKPWEFPDHIAELLKQGGFVLTPKARAEFDLRVGTDEFQLHHAIEKLSLYGEKNYDEDTIRQLIPEDANLDMWQLGNAFMKGDMAGVVRAKEQMFAKGMDVNAMIPLLASQLRRAYDIAALRDLGYDAARIAIRLHAKESGIRMTLKNISNRSARTLLHLESELASVEQGIKAGTLVPKDAFETYLLKYGGRHG